MILILLMALSAAALASAAGFFSVYGLTQIYAASALSVVVMGASLEFAKLIATSFLHRYWTKIGFALKSYLLIAVGVLMLITSIGIFGYLTAAYQQDTIPATEISQKLESDKTEVQRLIDRKNQIDTQVAKLPNSYVKARKQLMDSFSAEYNGLQPNIDRLNKEISELQSRKLNVDAKVGPIVYVAQFLGQDSTKAIIDLTVMITLVFDPLAVAMVIALNVAIEDWKRKREEKKSVKAPKIDHEVVPHSFDDLFFEEPPPKDSFESESTKEPESIKEDLILELEPIEVVEPEPIVEVNEEPEEFEIILPEEPQPTPPIESSKREEIMAKLRESIANDGMV